MKRVLLILFVLLGFVCSASASTLVVQWKQATMTTGDKWELAKNGKRFASISYIEAQNNYEMDLTGITVNSETDTISIRKVGASGFVSPWIPAEAQIEESPTDVIIYLKDE